MKNIKFIRKKIFLLVLLIPLNFMLAQNTENIFRNDNGVFSVKTIVKPQVSNLNNNIQGNLSNGHNPKGQSKSLYPPNIRWFYQDAHSIGGNCMVSGNGCYTSSVWDLNDKRVCLYGNMDTVPHWTFNMPSNTSYGYTAISDTAGIIVVSAYHEIDFFDNKSNTPFLTFSGDGIGGPVAITSDGKYVISSAYRNDSSTVFCLSSDDASVLWRQKINTSWNYSTYPYVNISRNDSLAIINTYYNFLVVEVATGNVRYTGTINENPGYKQGISGNGDYVATGDGFGLLKLYQWTGTTYTLKWTFQEPVSYYYPWITSIDISNDGTHLIAGTLLTYTGNSDGDIRFFNVNSNIPIWTNYNCGGLISQVQFNRNGNIATATTWGDVYDADPDFMVFKTIPEVSDPPLIYGLSTPGSLFNTSLSNSGNVAVANGKAVHAGTLGMGGLFYNLNIDTTYGPTSVLNNGQVTSEYKLYQNYPNPFNPYTLIKFSLPKNAFVNLKVYDVMGKEVMNLVNRNYSAGTYSTGFDASMLPSGVYFYKLTAGSYSEVKKMILVK